MPAAPARISFITQEFRSAVDVDASVSTTYGPIARDTFDAPVPSYFDSITDVQAMLDERFVLLKADRRKFTIAVGSIVAFTGALDFSQTVPAATVVDVEKVANFTGAIVGISAIDYENNTPTMIVWG
jgi:hypothetical protein